MKDRFGKKLILDEWVYVLLSGQVTRCTVIGRMLDDVYMVSKHDGSRMFHHVDQHQIVKIDKTDPRVTRFLLEHST